MTTLHDRLAELAEDAPPGAPAPDLWDRGRRHHRRQQVGTVLIGAVMVVLIGVLGTVSWVRAAGDPVPAGPADPLRLPSRFYDPGTRLADTAADGPLGRLVAVVGGERTDWRGRDSNGVAGVSASTGEYRFLDLPGRVEAEDVALSDDGRWLAYWYGEGARADGVAAYDADTGEVARLPIATDHGLMPVPLLWIDGELWFETWRYDANGHSSEPTESYVRWDPATGGHQETPLTTATRSMLSGAVAEGGIVSGSGRRLWVWDLPPAGAGERFRTDVPVLPGALRSPDGSRIAAIVDPDSPGFSTTQAGRLVMLTETGRGRLSTTPVPGRRANVVVGWRDLTHVVVRDYDHFAFWSVDVDTGRRERLTTPAPSLWKPGTIVSRDGWTAPTYDAPAPPSPLPPLVVGGLTLGIVLVGTAALLWWRRRVRP